jgi:hypothetical protein
VKRAGKDYSDGRDRLWGLSFRVDDIAAARGRMLAAGIDVSEPRAGRKPGTQVATVRSGTCGVPTILLQPPPARVSEPILRRRHPEVRGQQPEPRRIAVALRGIASQCISG